MGVKLSELSSSALNTLSTRKKSLKVSQLNHTAKVNKPQKVSKQHSKSLSVLKSRLRLVSNSSPYLQHPLVVNHALQSSLVRLNSWYNSSQLQLQKLDRVPPHAGSHAILAVFRINPICYMVRYAADGGGRSAIIIIYKQSLNNFNQMSDILLRSSSLRICFTRQLSLGDSLTFCYEWHLH